MKKAFYIGILLLALFEIVNVYFIMPMPRSQQINSIDLAYFLYSYRWIFRGIFGILILLGLYPVLTSRRPWLPLIAAMPVAIIVYMFNFKMTADRMFLPPEQLLFKSRGENTLSDSSVVVVVSNLLEAKAYPIRYIQYHHQVRDTIAGKAIMVTYCNVCRTGRVFEPVIEERIENFRLVGMDHFNAMFEDETTKSWWRQATGEAIAGPRKGKFLTEIESSQYTLGKFFLLYPFGKVMQAEARSKENYDTLGRFEKGKSKSNLTRTDTSSWNDKSWVVGIQLNDLSKAYDWNELKAKRVIHDNIDHTPISVALASDNQTFIALERNHNEEFTIRNDSLVSMSRRIDFAGRSKDGSQVKLIKSYQEFWHSWKQFHPRTYVHQ
ncbi:DUF3179 domain-containing (seleno)protein [Chryseosolibacter indicus]|uniref:DUF3179 domain-containing protein n=1 Tax=Chryseosolibacter indicus TaxID=2782351 RepID=A0ABS5VPG1_9BACT|nr:DUF3179 domain-containing (seleno)protein [Chryseosolibacter indicus]MBT1703314.1 DUF3179 domain-containing protein [Chryseosolibacter indicus]